MHGWESVRNAVNYLLIDCFNIFLFLMCASFAILLIFYGNSFLNKITKCDFSNLIFSLTDCFHYIHVIVSKAESFNYYFLNTNFASIPHSQKQGSTPILNKNILIIALPKSKGTLSLVASIPYYQVKSIYDCKSWIQ